MFFALLTLLTALALATVAGWFSIVGFMTIYAGAPFYALIMGAVTEIAKLVTASWLYRNWQYANWKLKVPLLYFVLALMIATSIGVFGFLSKAHIEQGADKIDNSAKIESLQYQIDREKAIIADNEKVISQLDATVNSLLGRDRADRALSVRRSQARQRDELRKDSAAAQKRIDELSSEKFRLESEVRKLQLEVGPIRYIAEMIYGVEENSTKNIEAAVRIFTLLLVSTLDPLAVILLVAANHTLLRMKHEGKEKTEQVIARNDAKSVKNDEVSNVEIKKNSKGYEEHRIEEDIELESPRSNNIQVYGGASPEVVKSINEEEKIFTKDLSPLLHGKIQTETNDKETDKKDSIIRESITNKTKSKVHSTEQIDEEEDTALEKFYNSTDLPPLPFVRSPKITKIEKEPAAMSADRVGDGQVYNTLQNSREEVQIIDKDRHSVPWAQQETVLRELLGNTQQHFIPKKVNEEDPKLSKEEKNSPPFPGTGAQINSKIVGADYTHKYPKALSWLKEFKEQKNE